MMLAEEAALHQQESFSHIKELPEQHRKTLHVILSNIANNPKAAKYRSLARSKERIATLLASPGVLEFLGSLGFSECGGNEALELEMRDGDVEAVRRGLAALALCGGTLETHGGGSGDGDGRATGETASREQREEKRGRDADTESPAPLSMPTVVRAVDLLRLAKQIDASEAAPDPREVSSVLKLAAKRIAELQMGVDTMSWQLSCVRSIVAPESQSFGPAAAAATPTKPRPTSAAATATAAASDPNSESSTSKSFLFKKGDAARGAKGDVAAAGGPAPAAAAVAAEDSAAAAKPLNRFTGGSGTAGAPGSSGAAAAPKTKAEMEKARRARYDKLQQRQEEQQEGERARLKKEEARARMMANMHGGRRYVIGQMDTYSKDS